MKLRDFLVPAGIQLNLSPGEKSVVLRQVAEALTEGGIAPNATDLLAKLMEREGIRSTAIGNKIAVPHAEIDEVGKTILTVRRTDKGFSIRKGYDRSFKELHPYGKGVTQFSSGGIVLSFHGYAVTLRRVDLTPGHGAPGGRTRPNPARAYYHLAMGETYTLSASGSVTIR